MKLTSQYTITNNDVTSIDEVAELWKKLFSLHHFLRYEVHIQPTDRDWVRRRTKLLEKANDMLVITAKADNKLVGYLIVSVHECDKTVGEIESLYVLKEYRKEDIGTEMMKEAMDWLNYKGVAIQKIAVGVENEQVIAFYNKLGFAPKSIILEKRGDESYRSVNK
ncbi:GNAT family N-acetyltransferase [Flammeovirga sp. EKP202]|uniref:GNAT family N-acetyltransferase n=1 Tax=Flammeovirga sp. EKP202 TaxID=2770592 RepID=UPI00165EDDA4|nr:GNAT family N-acetyltransferase [Flammeovirga sp. EKP202]MBD0404856.1 GNAT family N-acetyltransferase [Flammeovirga sp. EKP202]